MTTSDELRATPVEQLTHKGTRGPCRYQRLGRLAERAEESWLNRLADEAAR
ncbi:hypothetical protein [Kitasatospora sp. NPDC050543]|uniref:hypothetical protein n=1 Tax=Kitasatospora sp. NPDC050543 TaxID=3364054 RepID=UPI0037A42F1A